MRSAAFWWGRCSCCRCRRCSTTRAGSPNRWPSGRSASRPAHPPIPRGAQMPFGAGPRVCLRQHLAMTELTVIAAMLLQCFALLVPVGVAPPRPVMRLSLRPDKQLCLQLSPVTGG
ncbi:cytochrome P450 [Azospirillum sp. CT11-132]|uniref:cytochrome P450 n=1 Tax=Azospirillum sp. CT11-132 TaxID=3396317 RepID=UPI0039A3FF7C